MGNNIIETSIRNHAGDFKGNNIFNFWHGIPTDKISNARNIHNISINETVWMLIDTGRFVKNGKCSVLFLNEGLSISYGDSISGFNVSFIEWSSLRNIELIEDQYVFYGSREDDFVSWSIDDIIGLEDQKPRNLHGILNIINEIIAYNKEEDAKIDILTDELENKFNNAFEKSDFEGAMKISEEYITKIPDDYMGYFYKVKALFELKHYQESIKCIDEYESLLKNWNIRPDELDEKGQYYFSSFCNSKSLCYAELKKYFDAIWLNRISYKYFKDKELIKRANNYYETLYEQYKNAFLNLPLEERKLILITDEWPIYNFKKVNEYIAPSFKIFTIKYLPNIEFETEHPQLNKFYYAHPYLSNFYLSLESLENTLFEDKFWELCKLLQSLGAIRITVKYLDSDKSDSKINKKLKVGGEIKMVKSLKLSYDNLINSNNKSSIGRKIIGNQIFHPKRKPYIPNDLYWFNKENSWKRLAEQRLSGELISSKVNLSLNSSEFINNTTKRKIAGELKTLIFKTRGSFETELNIENTRETSRENEIEVEFAPIETLIEDNTSQSEVKNELLSENDSEYLDLFKDCIEDGLISEDERRILERCRMKLNMSNERVKYLESLIIQNSKFTKEELEYIEEYQFCLDDDNLISGDERRLLNRLISRLNINTDRVKELEEYVVKSKK